MTVRDTVFELTRAVQRNPRREELRHLYDRLEPPFGYLRRRHIVQFLGYLLVDERGGSWEGSLRVPSLGLSDDERRLLRGAHQDLVRLNSACLSPVLRVLPDLARAVNPYSEVDTLSSDEEGVSLLPPEQVAKVTEAFHQSAAVTNVLQGQERLASRISPKQQVQAVHELVRELGQAGVAAAPERVSAIFLGTPPGSIHRDILGYLGALVGVRLSMLMIDQLAFQAAVADRLSSLDTSNVIRIRSNTWTAVSHGFECDCIRNRRNTARITGLEAGEVIWIGLPTRHAEGLFHVEKTSMSMSKQDGEVARIAARQMDNDLNPYSRITQSSGRLS